MKRLIIAILAAAAAFSASAQGSTVKSVTMHSEALGTDKPYSIYLPAGYDSSDERYPVLYLLHGAWGDHTNWANNARMKEVADLILNSGTASPMIIVMPDASGVGNTTQHMGYFNQSGWEYEKYFYQELIPEIDSKYRTKPHRRHRAIAGLSMGGGGSVAYAQRYPSYWGSACSLSGLLSDMSSIDPKGTVSDYQESVRRNNPTRFVLEADSAAIDSLKSVRWYADCGDDDFLAPANVAFYQAMRDKGIPMEYRMRDGGHSWTYWSTGLPAILQFVSAGFNRP